MHLILHFARCSPALLVSVQKNRVYKGNYNVTGLLFGQGLKGGLLRTEYSGLGVHICVIIQVMARGQNATIPTNRKPGSHAYIYAKSYTGRRICMYK